LKTIIAIDNGTSGTIAIMKEDNIYFNNVPIFIQQSYTKTKQNISRINTYKLKEILKNIDNKNCLVLIERPMVNPMRFKASGSALRALEAVLIVVEELNLSYQYEDSKSWQREMLPKNLKKEELKKASLDIGNRLFPQFKDNKHPDRDSLLMAEYARRKNL